MLARHLTAIVLSIPATIVILSLVLAYGPASPAFRAPAFLMFLPLWLCVATASYLVPKTHIAALALLGTTAAGYAVLLLQPLSSGAAQ
ncbi:MAG: hypothetical protein AAGI88_12165 [Pseudomonadota bacterium]